MPFFGFDALEWGKWFETANRHVADTYTDNGRVSTIFLGINYCFSLKEDLFGLFYEFIGGHDTPCNAWNERGRICSTGTPNSDRWYTCHDG